MGGKELIMEKMWVVDPFISKYILVQPKTIPIKVMGL
jgi:hypothetical protein